VRAYVAALQRDDPRAAYGLLAAPVRRQLSYDDFARAWKLHPAERAWQARALERSLQGNPDASERALVRYPDGRLAQLEREGATWRLGSELVSRSRATRPRDAIRIFAEAVAARDVSGILSILSQRRREALTKQVEGFVAGIARRVNDRIDELGGDRAELRWDEAGIRYRVVLRREGDEWRVDDVYIREAPSEGAADADPEPAEDE
jgi:hypothetical protein